MHSLILLYLQAFKFSLSLLSAPR
uniref:Uncharacterized protein n=1 Tax=Rhizophora mucronata TaxID=61149 RepID=A0A2P2MY54_RHIMU